MKQSKVKFLYLVSLYLPREMKVALINTSDAGGGAAEACMRLLNALRQHGIEATVVVQEQRRQAEHVHGVNQSFFGKLKARFNFLLERIPYILFEEREKAVRFAFSTANVGTDITKDDVIKQADVIHIHWTNSGFLSVQDLKKLLALNKPVVWTLHDMWAFTGGCHYAGPCNHFKNQCGNCYFLRDPQDDDLSHSGWLRKSSLFEQAKNLSIVTCSHWLGEVAMKSSLLKGFMIEAIPNPIDTEVFSPKDKAAMRAKWKVTDSAKVILFGAANINDRRKGINFLVEALDHLKALSADERVEIVIFGKNKHFDTSTLPFPVHQLNTITSPSDLAEIYSLADVFISPSVEDNLPNMIMEAMACGTPVVAFNTGGIPDLVDHWTNGYLAEFKSSSDLATGLQMLLNTHEWDKYSSAARYKVKRVFNNEKVAGQYISLYQSVLKPVNG
ncbi:glycosyltransferase family 4 protein [Mucilaginibacter sp. 21P]|uniref:glycosyltransferase family 4 protein n=1 Tax=Mucilaginibacter sp. 21P TaxID=2778902 RepID=UPI001C595D57|nr:glycosyltransferase family 4 protein [Mucilaginibacter sp. 21P]QXV66623.1 glycosyltransferase family 4 protein [Mucilaginibacter sp. 21P]